MTYKMSMLNYISKYIILFFPVKKVYLRNPLTIFQVGSSTRVGIQMLLKKNINI